MFLYLDSFLFFKYLFYILHILSYIILADSIISKINFEEILWNFKKFFKKLAKEI